MELLAPSFDFGVGQTSLIPASNTGDEKPLIVVLSCLEDCEYEARALADVAVLEHVDYTEFNNGKIEAAAIVILRTLVYLPRGPKAKLHSGQVILCIGAPDKALELACADSNDLHLVHVDVPRTDEVADTVMGLILGLFRKTHALAEQGCTSHCWAGGVQATWQGMRRMRGLVLGLIGMNAAGRAVAKRAVSFGVKVLYYENDSMAPEDRLRGRVLQGARRVESLEKLLAASDILSLHCSVAQYKEYIINMDSIRFVKQGAVLINVSSSQLVEDAAVKEALAEGLLGGCALDGADPPSWMEAWVRENHNVLILPRSAHQSEEAWAELRTRVVRVARSYLGDGTLSETTISDEDARESEVFSPGERCAETREPSLKMDARNDRSSGGGSGDSSSSHGMQTQVPGWEEERAVEGDDGKLQQPAGADDAGPMNEDSGQDQLLNAEERVDDVGTMGVGLGIDVLVEGNLMQCSEEGDRQAKPDCTEGSTLSEPNNVQQGFLEQGLDHRATEIVVDASQGNSKQSEEGGTMRQLASDRREGSLHLVSCTTLAAAGPASQEQSGQTEDSSNLSHTAGIDVSPRKHCTSLSRGMLDTGVHKSIKQQIDVDREINGEEAETATTEVLLRNKFWEIVSLGRTLSAEPLDSPVRENSGASQSSDEDTSLFSSGLREELASHLQSPASSMLSPQYATDHRASPKLESMWKPEETQQRFAGSEEAKENLQPMYTRRRDIAGHIHWIEGSLEGSRRDDGRDSHEGQPQSHALPEDHSDNLSNHRHASSCTWSDHACVTAGNAGEDGRGSVKMESWPWGILLRSQSAGVGHTRTSSSLSDGKPGYNASPASPNGGPLPVTNQSGSASPADNLSADRHDSSQGSPQGSLGGSAEKSPRVLIRARTFSGLITGVFSKAVPKSPREAKRVIDSDFSHSESQFLREGKVVQLRSATYEGYFTTQQTPTGWTLALSSEIFTKNPASKFVIVREKDKLGFRSLIADGKLLQANSKSELLFVNRRFNAPEMWVAEVKNGISRLANVRYRGVILEVFIEPLSSLSDSTQVSHGGDDTISEETGQP